MPNNLNPTHLFDVTDECFAHNIKRHTRSGNQINNCFLNPDLVSCFNFVLQNSTFMIILSATGIKYSNFKAIYLYTTDC